MLFMIIITYVLLTTEQVFQQTTNWNAFPGSNFSMTVKSTPAVISLKLLFNFEVQLHFPNKDASFFFYSTLGH